MCSPRSHLGCRSAHVGHHAARDTRLKDVGGGKVVNLLQRHLGRTRTQTQVSQFCKASSTLVVFDKFKFGCQAALQDYSGEKKTHLNEFFMDL